MPSVFLNTKKYSCNHLCKDAEENKTKEVCEQQYVREDNETNMLKNKMTIEHMNLHYGEKGLVWYFRRQIHFR